MLCDNLHDDLRDDLFRGDRTGTALSAVLEK